ncbi:uncharacterized protein LOC109616646 [Esox lucius]|uniref:uncharacterized protein LOC109616646 n=1 Tax=Esox lucius TaxID=8010 RepID=UPI00147771AE|nr:uncharacterized protein LOC109616646 [Esox lucius]
MGGPSTSLWTLLISAIGIACEATLISADSMILPINETQQWSMENRTMNNAPQEVFNITTVNQATSRIYNAVDTLSTQLSIFGANNQSHTEVEVNGLQEDLRQIKDLTLKVFLYLTEVQDIFGVLNILNTYDVRSVTFISLWFNIQLKPLLPDITGEIMTLLSTKDFSCSSYQALVKGFSDEHELIDTEQQQVIFSNFIYPFLSRNDSGGCVSNTNSSTVWLKKNFGIYSAFAELSELRILNPDFSSVAVLDILSPNQKVELILDPSSGALENETLVREVFVTLLDSEEQLEEFYVTFVEVTTQENITIITNTAVRDTMLNLTLTALAPKFYDFEPTDFQLWFQVNLDVLLASILPASLVVIPQNISCESYSAIYIGLDQSLASLPSNLSQGVQSSLNALTATFQRCPRPAVHIVCQETLVNEVQLCAGISSSQDLSSGNSSESLCKFTIPQYACSATTHLSADNLATLLKCQLASNETYSTAIWKLFFQNNAAVLGQALLEYSSMNASISSPAMPQVLDAIGEVIINNFTNAQLNNAALIAELFQTMLRPFLASPSSNFLSCLSSKNFSCQTYQIVVAAISSQSASINTVQQQVIFTRFIYPFLSRNDSSDPGCVLSTSGSTDWLQKNFGVFGVFADLSELIVLNPDFSSKDSLSLLTPTQVAQWILTSGVLNDTNDITLVFERLQEGDAFQNIDTFLTQLTASEMVVDILPVVRDEMMNQTFYIISPHFPQFEQVDWIAWFKVKLIPILPSFTEVMLTNATSYVNCTNYQVIVKGMSSAFSKMTNDRREDIAMVLLTYLKRSLQFINGPACSQDIHNSADWLEINLGLYSEYVTYSDLKTFNISLFAVLDYFSPNQIAEFILDPINLANETLVEEVFLWVLQSSDLGEIGIFFQSFVDVAAMVNMTSIQPGLRDILLNMTLTALAPKFNTLDTQGYELWFQVYLQLLLPGIQPGTFSIIPRNISCDSFSAIVKGCDNVVSQLSPTQSQQVYLFLMDYLTDQSVEDQSILTQPNCFRTLLQLVASRPSYFCNSP